MRARSLVVLAALVLGAPLRAQQPSPPTCAAPEHRQFDFWLGEWSVADTAGRPIGQSEITREFGGCVIRERWNVRLPRGGGESLNAYDRVTKRWHQTWMDDAGNVWKTDGVLEGASMVLTRTGPTMRDPTRDVLHRWTWTPTGPDQVRQHAEISADGGKTWTTTFDGRYTRRR